MMPPIVKKALYFAAQKHDGQYRKAGNVPYIVHPTQVALGVSTYTKDEEVVAAAFLHDVLEDCPTVSVNTLQKEFGNKIAQLVDEVSLVANKKFATWKERKEIYLKKIKDASKEALIIVAVDKVANMQAYVEALEKQGNDVAKYFGGTPDEYCWYYTEVYNTLISTLGTCPLTQDYLAIWELHKNRILHLVHV